MENQVKKLTDEQQKQIQNHVFSSSSTGLTASAASAASAVSAIAAGPAESATTHKAAPAFLEQACLMAKHHLPESCLAVLISGLALRFALDNYPISTALMVTGATATLAYRNSRVVRDMVDKTTASVQNLRAKHQ